MGEAATSVAVAAKMSARTLIADGFVLGLWDCGRIGVAEWIVRVGVMYGTRVTGQKFWVKDIKSIKNEQIISLRRENEIITVIE